MLRETDASNKELTGYLKASDIVTLKSSVLLILTMTTGKPLDFKEQLC